MDMITVGVDFHKRSSSYCIMDVDGNVMKRCKLENNTENIVGFLNKIEGPKQLAMEATYNWGLYYDTAAPHVDKFLLGHPLKMKAITASESKCDRNDAQMITQLAAMGFLPQAYTPSRDSRQLRSLVRFRALLLKQRVAVRNNTQALLDRNVWPGNRPKSFKNIYCKRGRRWMKEVELPQKERFVLDELIKTYDHTSEQISRIEKYVARETVDLPGIRHLRTVDGLKRSKINIYAILFEIADISRFRKARHLVKYAGLIPSEHSSGDKQRTGRLVKRANHVLRTAIIESTFSALLADKNLKAYYQTVKARCGSSSAIIACARKLCYAIYHVLKEERPYRTFPPAAAMGP